MRIRHGFCKKVIAIMGLMIACPIWAQSGLVGKTYNVAIRGSAFDPVKRASSPMTRLAFTNTLNGPQTPGILVKRSGHDLLVFETCTAHLCAFQRSITVVDVRSGDLYAAVYGDNKQIVVPNRELEYLIGNSCDGNACNFGTVEETGELIIPEPLTEDDVKGFQGGAACKLFDQAGHLLLYTEGKGVMRFKGQRRIVHEQDGIGNGPFYSVDHEPPLVLSLKPRAGRAVSGHSLYGSEISLRPLTATVLMNSRTVEFLVVERCES